MILSKDHQNPQDIVNERNIRLLRTDGAFSTCYTRKKRRKGGEKNECILASSKFNSVRADNICAIATIQRHKEKTDEPPGKTHHRNSG